MKYQYYSLLKVQKYLNLNGQNIYQEVISMKKPIQYINKSMFLYLFFLKKSHHIRWMVFISNKKDHKAVSCNFSIHFFIKSSSNEDQNQTTENIHTKSLVDDLFISSFYFIKPLTKIIEIIKFMIVSGRIRVRFIIIIPYSSYVIHRWSSCMSTKQSLPFG